MLTLWAGALESLVNFCMLLPDMAMDINSIPATTQNVSLPLPSSFQSGLERARLCEGRSSIKRTASNWNDEVLHDRVALVAPGGQNYRRPKSIHLGQMQLPIALGWRAQNSAQAQGRDEP